LQRKTRCRRFRYLGLLNKDRIETTFILEIKPIS
jgi:hypothetical protein